MTMTFKVTLPDVRRTRGQGTESLKQVSGRGQAAENTAKGSRLVGITGRWRHVRFAPKSGVRQRIEHPRNFEASEMLWLSFVGWRLSVTWEKQALYCEPSKPNRIGHSIRH